MYTIRQVVILLLIFGWRKDVFAKLIFVCSVIRRLNNKLGVFQKIKLLRTGTVLIEFQENIVLVPYTMKSEKNLKRYFQAHKTLQSHMLSKYFTYQFDKMCFKNRDVYIQERLYPVHDPSRLNDVLGVISFGQFTFRGRIQDCKNIPWLGHTFRIPLLNDLRKSLQDYPISSSIGFTHGDFYHSNIMQKGDGSIQLIDLDRIELSGLQLYDHLHNLVHSHFQEDNWFEAVGSFVRSGDWSPSDAGFYVLNRCYYEFRNGEFFSKNYYLHAGS